MGMDELVDRLRAVVQAWMDENHGEMPPVAFAAGVVWDKAGEGIYKVVTGCPPMSVSLLSGAALKEVA